MTTSCLFLLFTEHLALFERMGNANDFKKLVAKGVYLAFDNCFYLCGACNVGKSTLASVLIDEEIPKIWFSTDGLQIHFGRNGIDLKEKKMVPLKEGNY